MLGKDALTSRIHPSPSIQVAEHVQCHFGRQQREEIPAQVRLQRAVQLHHHARILHVSVGAGHMGDEVRKR